MTILQQVPLDHGRKDYGFLKAILLKEQSNCDVLLHDTFEKSLRKKREFYIDTRHQVMKKLNSSSSAYITYGGVFETYNGVT